MKRSILLIIVVYLEIAAALAIGFFLNYHFKAGLLNSIILAFALFVLFAVSIVVSRLILR